MRAWRVYRRHGALPSFGGNPVTGLVEPWRIDMPKPPPFLHGLVAAVTLIVLVTGCGGEAKQLTTVRLVDLFADAVVVDAVESVEIEPTVLRFDGTSTVQDPKEPEETLGWEAAHEVSDLKIGDGHLLGKINSDLAILTLAQPDDLAQGDLLHAFEIRLRSTVEVKLHMVPARLKPEIKDPEDWKDETRWRYTTVVEAGDDFKTYTLTSTHTAPPPSLGRSSFVVVILEDAAGAKFEMESIRFITRREELARIPSGIGFHGLSDVYRETLVTRAPETVLYEVDVPPRPWMEVHLGTIDDGPIRFRVDVRQGEDHTPLLTQTLTTPRRWEKAAEENAAQDKRSEELEKALEEMDKAYMHLPSTAQLEEAKIDADAFVGHELDWYDASIRAMDTEVGRLLEGLENLGLEDDVVIAFTSDHGEEFLDHGRHFHGSSTYGELTNVPLVLHWSGVVPAMRELYDYDQDPLDQEDVAAEHPEVVERLAGLIAEWQTAALAVKLSPAEDAEMAPEELEKLRALGYIN